MTIIPKSDFLLKPSSPTMCSVFSYWNLWTILINCHIWYPNSYCSTILTNHIFSIEYHHIFTFDLIDLLYFTTFFLSLILPITTFF